MIFFLAPMLFWADFSQITLLQYVSLFWLWGLAVVWVLAHLKSYKYLPVWIVQSIVSLNIVIILILGYFFYNENLSIYWYIWASIILVAWIWMALVQNNHSHLDKDKFTYWVMLCLIRAVMLSLWIFWFAYFCKEIDFYAWVFMSEFTILIAFIPFVLYRKYYKKEAFLSTYSRDDIKKTFYFSSIVAISTITYFMAMNIGSISMVNLIFSTVNIFVALVGHYFYKEKLLKSQWSMIFLTVIWMFVLNFDKLS